MKAVEEQSLIEKVQQHHDPMAFRELYRHYFPRIYGYVAYRVGHTLDREDVVSEVFLKALEKLDRFTYRGEGSFAAWLFRIAHNTVSSFYRSHVPIQVEMEEVMLDQLLIDDTPAPDSAVLKQEIFARLHDYLRSLPPQRQKVISLRFFGGLRNQEIAEILGLDARTVASHLTRGLADLHQLFSQDELVYEVDYE